jgi:hypothetical protein
VETLKKYGLAILGLMTALVVFLLGRSSADKSRGDELEKAETAAATKEVAVAQESTKEAKEQSDEQTKNYDELKRNNADLLRRIGITPTDTHGG